jgi:hypothetical protein
MGDQGRPVRDIDAADLLLSKCQAMVSQALNQSADPAWIKHSAVANFEQASFEVVSHLPPCVNDG